MAEYDNTNDGVAFPPFEDMKMILQGVKVDMLLCVDKPKAAWRSWKSLKRLV